MLKTLYRCASRLTPNIYLFNFLFALPFFVKGNRRLPRSTGNARAEINDFIFHRMLRNRWTVWQQACVDKEYAKAIARTDDASVVIVPTLAVIPVKGLTVSQLKTLLAPFVGKPIVAKPTNNSGGVVFLRNGLNDRDVRQLFELASANFFYARRETQYKNLEGKIILEEDISEGAAPVDYKFFCSRGKVFYCQVDTERFSSHKRALCALPSFNMLPLTYGYPVPDDLPKPRLLERMMAIASKLSSSFDFVRIDLYEKGDDVVFGEFTFSPCSGCDRISDSAFAARFLEDVRRSSAKPLSTAPVA